MLGKIVRIQILWIDRKNPNKVINLSVEIIQIIVIKFFLSIRFETESDKIDIRGYVKNTRYAELCEQMSERQTVDVPVKLHNQRYYFD